MQRGFLGASSDWSWQSKSPSHSHELWIRQRPLAQRNSLGLHVGYSAVRNGTPVKKRVEQKRERGGEELVTGHSPHSWDSSEPSLQSLSWSHTKCLGMHCRFWHMNSLLLHVLLNTETLKHMWGLNEVNNDCTGAVWIYVFLCEMFLDPSLLSPQPALTLSSAPSGQSLSPSHFQR